MPFSTYLSTGTIAVLNIMMGFLRASRTAEAMPRVWIDLGQNFTLTAHRFGKVWVFGCVRKFGVVGRKEELYLLLLVIPEYL